MSQEEKDIKWGELYSYVSTHTGNLKTWFYCYSHVLCYLWYAAQNYVETFVKELPRVHDASQHMEASHIPLLSFDMVLEEYDMSLRRIFVSIIYL